MFYSIKNRDDWKENVREIYNNESNVYNAIYLIKNNKLYVLKYDYDKNKYLINGKDYREENAFLNLELLAITLTSE